MEIYHELNIGRMIDEMKEEKWVMHNEKKVKNINVIHGKANN